MKKLNTVLLLLTLSISFFLVGFSNETFAITDVTPPEVTSLTIDKSDVKPGDVVTVTVIASDESGISDKSYDNTLSFIDPAGHYKYVSFTLQSDGTYQGSLEITEAFLDGEYRVHSGNITDIYGNVAELNVYSNLYFTVNSVLYSGTCGDSLEWELSYDGKLTISGTGDMQDCGYDSAPWRDYKEIINTVVVEEGVTSIGRGAFEHYIGINSVSLPSTMRILYNRSFYDCEGIVAINLPEGIEKLDDSAFSECASLMSINIPLSVKYIGDGCFWGCTSLESLYIPDTVTFIGDRVFYDVTGTFYVKKGSVIDKYALDDGKTVEYVCTYGHVWSEDYSVDVAPTFDQDGLESIHCSVCDIVKEGTERPVSAVDALYGKGTCGEIATWSLNYAGVLTISGSGDMQDCGWKTAPWYNYCTHIEHVIVSDGITGIAPGAFEDCVNLKTVTLPESITYIGPYAFAYCNSLEAFTFPTHLISIEYGTFRDCYALSTLDIPVGINTIGYNAFYNCTGLKELYIPDTVDDIGEYSFINVTANIYVKKGSYVDAFLKQEGVNIVYTCKYGHVWNDDYSVDVAPTCLEEGLESIHCSVCEEIKSETSRSIDAIGHDWDGGTITTEPTCIKEGVKTFTCNNCGATETETIPANGHTWDTEFTVDQDPSCTTDGSKSKHCANCDEKIEVTVVPATGHDWDGGKITKEPTCTKEGVKTFTCNNCGSTETEAIPANGHTWDAEFTVDQEASCTVDGSKSKHCAYCDEISEVTAIPAYGHSFGEWVEVTASSCENPGLRQHICEYCGFTESEQLDPNGHDWEDDYTEDLPATCTEDGSKSIHCKNCDAVTDSQVIPAKGHSYGDWKTTKEPTCTASGSRAQTCSGCGDKITETIPALGHAWNDGPTVDTPATCTEAGSQSVHCARCDATKDEQTIPAFGHEWGETLTVDKPATCLEDGEESIHCIHCDAVQEGTTQTIPKSGHSFSAWKVTTKATELAAGKQTRTCSVCGKTETKTIAQLKPTLPAVKIKAPKKAKKAMTVKWTKVSKKNQKKIDLIQIQYSLDKSFKTGVKTTTAKKTAASKKIKSLTSKKTYYVRIRAYKKSGSVVHVSAWSTIKSVKVK